MTYVGSLAWIPEDELLELELWEGDRLFMPKVIGEEEFFRMRLEYDRDVLIGVK